MSAAHVVCIVTYERPEFLRRCLRSLATQRAEFEDVVVVDASSVADREVADDVGFAVTYVWAPQLAGWMTRSRNEALRHVDAELVTFIDDDVVVHDGWARAIREAFADPQVGAVAGRTRNLLEGEERYDQPIGKLLPNGQLTDGFASEAQGYVEIDHGIGANMSFRNSILTELHGFRDDYPGTALREDTDIFLRVGALGFRRVFAPQAVVDHLPAPHVHGQRFDWRYKVYGRRNHAVLLARNVGIRAPHLWRWAASDLSRIPQAGSPLRVLQRLGVTVLGVGWGLAALPRAARWRALDPRQRSR